MNTLLRRCRSVVPESLRTLMWKCGRFLAGNELGVEGFGMDWSLKKLRKLGFSPKFIVDVGAFVGEWTSLAKSVFPDAKILMIEPQKIRQPELLEVCKQFAGDVEFASVLVGPRGGAEVEFNEMSH